MRTFTNGCPFQKPHPVIPRPDRAHIKGNGEFTGPLTKHEICRRRSVIAVARGPKATNEVARLKFRDHEANCSEQASPAKRLFEFLIGFARKSKAEGIDCENRASFIQYLGFCLMSRLRCVTAGSYQPDEMLSVE